MERASVMGSAELDREKTEPVTGLARFSRHILSTHDEIRPDVAAGRRQVRYTLNLAAAPSLPPSPLHTDLGDWKGGRDDATAGSD
jgi:hypothetical protein